VKRKLLGVMLLVVVVVLAWFGWMISDKLNPRQSRLASARRERPVNIAPALEVKADLPWDTIYVGDPLRVRVLVASPRARQERYRRQVQREHGEQPTAASFIPAKLPDNWASGTVLSLYRVENDGRTTRVLAGKAWDPYLVPNSRDIQGIAVRLPVTFQDWLVPPEARNLTEGRYALQVSWTGRGMVNASYLDASGELKGSDFEFVVERPVEPGQQANHSARLANYEMSRHNYDNARSYARKALDLAPDKIAPEIILMHFVVATSSIALKDLTSAEAAYRGLLSQFSDGVNNDFVLTARSGLDAIGSARPK
jgi:hypothetical protein